jgi:hypothetical protein
MSKRDLYEATRGVWKLDLQRASKAKYALAIFEGIVCEVYRIGKWVAAGSTRYLTRPKREVKRYGRIEFVGRVAENRIRRKYAGRSVSEHHLPLGLRAPIVYVNC